MLSSNRPALVLFEVAPSQFVSLIALLTDQITTLSDQQPCLPPSHRDEWLVEPTTYYLHDAWMYVRAQFERTIVSFVSDSDLFQVVNIHSATYFM